jgi:hypothetical protein
MSFGTLPGDVNAAGSTSTVTDGDGATAAKAVLASVTPAKEAQPAATAKYCDLNVILSIPIFG